MKLIELHILQSYPVSCLNRDDVGSPKTATFGGVTRARISSQCLKRAVREYAQDNLPQARFGGERTKLIVKPLVESLKANGISDDKIAVEHAKNIADKLAKLDPKSKDDPKLGTLIFLAPSEIESIGKQVAALVNDNPKTKDYEKQLDKFCKSAGLVDGADIAIFGRMAASMPSLTLEGAGLFSHALSTHKSDNDLDFYSAVDEKLGEEDAGAGMIGTLEFSSAVYYRYAALNLDLLSDEAHLASLTADERKQVVDGFIRATLGAVPGARKNSMNAHTLPGFVLGTYKSTGQPVQLVNAFENPVQSRSGLLGDSIETMKAHHASLKETWGINCDTEVAIPDVNLNDFCEGLTSHVS